MQLRYILACLAVVVPLLATGCCTHGHGCNRCGTGTTAQAIPVAPIQPSPQPCCNGAAPGGPVVPVPQQPSYSIPVYPSKNGLP